MHKTASMGYIHLGMPLLQKVAKANAQRRRLANRPTSVIGMYSPFFLTNCST